MTIHQRTLIRIQTQIHASIGRRTDVHYKEGYGALFVEEGDALIPQNVIHAVSDFELALLGGTQT